MNPKTFEAADPALHFTALSARPGTYAGLGSRITPPRVLLLMEQLAGILALRGLTLRSGGGSGAEAAFEAGCDQMKGAKEIFLPWRGFNGRRSRHFRPPQRAEQIAAFLHPNWGACALPIRRLHAGRVQQIYGVGMDDPVDFVLFWSPERDGCVRGGSATAVNLAREMGIPTFNLWHPGIFRAATQQVYFFGL